VDIAEKIHELMNRRGITPYRLSKETGVSYTGLTKILNGTTKNPQIDSLKLIADYFGESIDYFTIDDQHQTATPPWATSKDKRDLEKFLNDPSGLYYKGVEFSEEQKAKMIGVLETIFWEAKRQNKEAYKKSREKNNKNNS